MRTRYWIAMMGAAWIAGCGSGEVTTNGGEDVISQDTASADTDSDDAALDTLDQVDTGTDTGTVAPDTSDDTLGLGALGDLCEEDPECASGYCLDLVAGEGGGLCTQRCTGDCPAGFDCIAVAASGSDLEQLCMPEALCLDADGDGFGYGNACAGSDCDDTDARINPLMDEVCDGIDNDCNSRVDENTIDSRLDCETGFQGQCADGRTACAGGSIVCEPVTPPVEEICNGEDDDCDGAIDEEPTDGRVVYLDGDADNHGDPATETTICGDIPGFVSLGDDCDDTAPAVHPGAEELCDGADQDCDGVIDEDVVDRTFYPDNDGDGYGDDGGVPVVDCAPPAGYAPVGGDCADGDPTVNPGAPEGVGDARDQNCDGAELCYQDHDGDGHRSVDPIEIASADLDCSDASEALASLPADDCNENDPETYAGATEYCDGRDNDCDGVIDDSCVCGAGLRMCGTTCISADACCTDADCGGGAACVGGACSCSAHATRACSGNDVYFYDSCGVREDLAEACTGGEVCEGGVCTCTSHASLECYSTDVYWFDSCGRREDRQDDCSGGETCVGGTCQCPAGYRYCGSTCIPIDTCCSSADCYDRCSAPGGECTGGIMEPCNSDGTCGSGRCESGLCRDFGGLYQVFDTEAAFPVGECAGGTQDISTRTNEITGAQSCPSGFLGQTVRMAGPVCNSDLERNASVTFCEPATLPSGGSYGGVFQRHHDWCSSSCVVPNRYTGSCMCPAGYTYQVWEGYVTPDEFPGCDWGTGYHQTQVVMCVRNGAGAGLFIESDLEPCAAPCEDPNPVTGSCSCETGTAVGAIRSEVYLPGRVCPAVSNWDHPGTNISFCY